jgi:hypothetical protein
VESSSKGGRVSTLGVKTHEQSLPRTACKTADNEQPLAISRLTARCGEGTAKAQAAVNAHPGRAALMQGINVMLERNCHAFARQVRKSGMVHVPLLCLVEEEKAIRARARWIPFRQKGASRTGA